MSDQRDQETDQNLPVASDGPLVHDLVIDDLKGRQFLGKSKYGFALQPNNGRDMLLDAYEEALDLACYLRALIIERDGHK